MSASPEKKSQSRAERDEKRRREEQKDRRSMAVYTVVAIVVVAAALAMLVWNSGLLQRNLTALDVNGTKYTAADVQYYYRNIYSTYGQNYAFDTSASVKKQIYDEESGQTWYDFLVDQAVEALTSSTALAQKANSEGYALSADAKTDLDAYLAQLDTAWIGYASRDAFARANFGPYMTYDRLTALISQEYLASDYAQSQLDAIDHSDADYQAYYKEHTDELDTVTYTQFSFQASLPSTDADGNTIERTEAETAAQLDAAKTEQKALAEEVKSKLEGGADPEALAEEYKDQLYTSSLSASSTGSSLTAYYTYGEWLVDGARKSGDIDLFERDYGTSCTYYVVIFQGRERVEEETHNVRHLLIRAGDNSSTPTQAEYDEAEKKAQSLLDEWKAGEATEDSFAALVSANTDDGGSKSTGGLYSNITSASSYAEPFLDWAIDPARREGDVELVKTEFGWHIMYYVSTGDPVWEQTAASALRNQDYETMIDSITQSWNISRGMGMNLISA